MICFCGGNFVYNDLELCIMEEDILCVVELELDVFVLGILILNNYIDIEVIE